MNNTSKVSIIINCYNGEKYLKRCLKSIINQSLQNWEVIFFDNQSTDFSKKIFQKFNERRFRYFLSKKFLKLYDARNEAISKSEGDFIAFLDCDDWWEANHLYNAKIFFEDDNYDLYFSNAYNYLEKKKKFILHRNKLPNKDIFNALIKDYSVKISSLIIRKKNIIKNNKNHIFNSKYNIIGDYDFVIDMASKFNFYTNSNPTVNCSFHGENYSLKNRNEYLEEFNYWYKNIDFNNKNFFKLKNVIDDNLLYINLFNKLTNNKSMNLFFEILKIRKIKNKIKLIIILMMPKRLINFFLNKYQV